MTPWSDAEIGRFVKRTAVFERRGLDAAMAEEIADFLAERDRERDERRMCIECAHLQLSGGCFLARQQQLHTGSGSLEPADLRPLKRTLQRCHGFQWQLP